MNEIKKQYEAFVEKHGYPDNRKDKKFMSELQDLMRAVGVKFAEYCQIREHDPDEELFTEFINQLK